MSRGGLEATADKAADLQRFIERARQVTRLTEPAPEIDHEFIRKRKKKTAQQPPRRPNQMIFTYGRRNGAASLWELPCSGLLSFRF